jgi:hypothetical protein
VLTVSTVRSNAMCRKKQNLYGEIHDAVILYDVLFAVDVVGTTLMLGLWDAWCF